MSWLEDIRILYPWLLLLLLAAPAYFLWLSRWKDRYIGRFQMPSRDLGTTTSQGTSWKVYLLHSLPLWIGLFWISAVVALSRPQQILTEEEVKAEGIDIFLAMDISSSMLSRDFKPDRLTVSKRVASEFVDKREYDRIGLVVFAGESYTQSPLTTDHRVINSYLEGLECGYLEDGTAIGMGLGAAVNRIKDSESRSKVIILLTDGVNNAGYISPEIATELAQEFGVRVYTIGVGSIGTAMSPVSRKQNGEYLFGLARVEIDEELLRTIARTTGGRYYRATSNETLVRVYEEIDKLEKTEMEITVFKRYKELFRLPLAVALGSLVAWFAIKYPLLRVWPD